MTLQRLFLYASLNERVENQMEDEDHQNAFAIIAIVPIPMEKRELAGWSE